MEKKDLKDGDIIQISGYYFDWIVKIGYSKLYKKDGIYAEAQGGLMHSDIDGDFKRIGNINL